MDKDDIIDLIADLYEQYDIYELGFDLNEYCKKSINFINTVFIF